MSVWGLAAAILAAGASTAALLTLGQAGYVSLRAHRQRGQLRHHFERLRQLDIGVTTAAAELDRSLAAGMEWAGFSLWPPELQDGTGYLEAVIDETERTEAAIRAVDEATPSIGRLRADMEHLHAILRTAASNYLDGVCSSYQSNQGQPQPSTPGGREPTPALTNDAANDQTELRTRFTLLVRSCASRLDSKAAGSYECGWPIARWEVEQVPIDTNPDRPT